MRRTHFSRNFSARRLKGFTLIELLVVVAIIALLISILLPALQMAKKQAQAAVCMSNVQQLYLGLRTYQDEHGGNLPVSVGADGTVGSLWSEASWGVAKKDLWFYKLTPKYVGNPDVFQCAGDPFRSDFDYEASLTPGGPARTDLTAPACGYGMSYFLRHFDWYEPTGTLMNTDRVRSAWPSRTILCAEVGPDSDAGEAPLFGSPDPGLSKPWRDGGRILWDDGIRQWGNQPTWLTARHLGSINMLTMDGGVRRVNTVKQLTNPLKGRYLGNDKIFGDCYGFDMKSRKYVCRMCQHRQGQENHYSFARSGLWWWVGPVKFDDPGQ